MPTYEYVCDSCGHEFEQFQAITAKPLRVCPRCGKKTAKRLIGVGAGVIFRGSGFYETDYRSESYKKAAEKESKSTDSSTDKKETKGAAKEAATGTKSETAAKKEKRKSA